MDSHGPTSHSFASQRLRLRYVDWGNHDAPPLILLHGGRDHSRSWDWVAQELRKDWHVICPDLRGHGDSDWNSDGHYVVAGHVYDLAQLVHTLGFERVTIIGHSLGGNVATRFTGLFPDKVERLVNIEGLGFPTDVIEQAAKETDRQHMRRWIEECRRVGDSETKRYPTLEAASARMKFFNPRLSDEQAYHLAIHNLNSNSDGSWSWKYDPMLNTWNPIDPGYEEIPEVWGAITCPILMLWSTGSIFAIPEEDGPLQYFRDLRFKVYDDAGHWLHHDQFDRFMADVTAFLGE